MTAGPISDITKEMKPNGGCDDCFFGGKKVGTRGPAASPFVIVGESPGIMELHKGKPLVGPSGDVVIDTLKQIFGLPKDATEDDFPIHPYITNAIHCLPRKKTPESLASACVRCRKRLLDEIQAYPRKVILVLGNGALWSVLGDFNLKITKERGKLFKSPLAEIGVVTAVHPAFLLRGGGNYVQFKRDLQYAVDLAMEGEEALKLPNGVKYRILEEAEEVITFVQELKNLPPKTVVACDIETTGFSHVHNKAFATGFQHTPQLVTIIPRHLMMKSVFENDALWVWHNGKFDIKFLRQDGIPARVDGDTMLLSYTLNERRGVHDLDQAASDWLGSPNHKDMLKPYLEGKILVGEDEKGKPVYRKKNYDDVPKDVLYKYLALDMSDTYFLYQKLRPMVAENKDLEKFYTRHLLPASEYLAKVEMNGFMVDTAQLDKNDASLTAKKEGFKAEINEVAMKVLGHEINPGSWQQIKTLFYDTGGLGLGNMSLGTDDKTLETLPKHPVVKSLQDFREASKAWGTYVKGVRKHITPTYLRVHTTFLLHGTATSRLSSKDPNMQNIPRDPELRGQFMPPPGYGLIECDYSQAELRSLACLSGCPALMEIFISGKDLHVELSTFLFGENFTREDKMKAKTVNFGIVYGRTAPSIAQAFNVSVQEAQSWIDGWFTRFPGAAAYIQKCRNAPLLNQTITTTFGNKKRPGVITPEKLNDYQNESANFPHQSIASNLTCQAGIRLFDNLRDNYDTHICNTVHDCIVAFTPLVKDNLIAVSNLITTTMSAIPHEWPGLSRVPFKSTSEFGLRWGNLFDFDKLETEYNWDFDKIPLHIAAH